MAYQPGKHRTLPNSLFDEVIQEHGEVVKSTELQKLRGTSLLNGNRYCVIDPTAKGTIPDWISVTNPVTKTDFPILPPLQGSVVVLPSS